MNADQVIEGIGKAVAAAKPGQEYCFLWIDHWSTCMTKSEWSGWMQAIFSVLAIVAALFIATRQRRQAIDDAHKKDISLMRACLKAVLDARAALNDVERKITGDSERPPSSSRARMESLERTFQALLTKDVPQETVKALLIVLREIAYTKRAIDESSHRAPDPDGERARKATSRTRVVRLVAQALRKDLDIQLAAKVPFWGSSGPARSEAGSELDRLK